MKKHITTLIFFFLSTFTLRSQTQINWQKTLGGDYFETLKEVLPLDDGGYLVFGTVRSLDRTGTVNTSTTDVNYYSRIWLVRLDSIGNIVSQKAYILTGERSFDALSIIKTNDSGYLIASETTNNFILLIKVNSNLTEEWRKGFTGNTKVYFTTFMQLPNNEYIILFNTSATDGDFPSTEPFHIARNWVFQLNQSGNLIWKKVMPKVKNDIAQFCSLTPTGKPQIYFNCTQDFNTGIRKIELNNLGDVTDDKMTNLPTDFLGLNMAITGMYKSSKGVIALCNYYQDYQFKSALLVYDESLNQIKLKKKYSIYLSEVKKMIDAKDGGFYYTGGRGSLGFGKFYSDGNLHWQDYKTSTSVGDQSVTCLETRDGSFLLCGMVGGKGRDVINHYPTCRTCAYTNIWIANVSHSTKQVEVSPLNDTFSNTLCTNTPTNIHFSTKGIYPTTTFQAQVSDNTGSFSNPTNLLSTGTTSPLNVTIPSYITPSSNYKIRINAIGDATSQSTASSINIINTLPNSTLNLDSTIRKGEFFNLNVNFSGGYPYLFKLNDNVSRFSETNRKTVSLQLYQSTTFRVDSVKNVCGLGSSTGFANINVENKYCRVASNCTSYGIGTIDIKKANNEQIFYKNDGICTNGYTLNNTNAKLKIDSTYNFNVVNYSSIYYQTYLKIWVDYNQDSTFNDNELIFMQNETSGDKNGTFTIPSTAKQGKTRMRIRGSADTYFGPVFDQCNKITNGETEDLTIWIINHNSCPDSYTTQDNTSNQTIKIEAFDVINSNKIIDNSSNIIYDAGKKIILQSGFEVKNGSTFLAKIEGCGGN